MWTGYYSHVIHFLLQLFIGPSDKPVKAQWWLCLRTVRWKEVGEAAGWFEELLGLDVMQRTSVLTTLRMTAAEPSNFCPVLHSSLLISNYGYSELLPHFCISCMYFELARYDMQRTCRILQAWIRPALKTKSGGTKDILCATLWKWYWWVWGYQYFL